MVSHPLDIKLGSDEPMSISMYIQWNVSRGTRLLTGHVSDRDSFSWNRIFTYIILYSNTSLNGTPAATGP